MKSEHAKLAEEVSRLIAANKLSTERIAKLEQSASASSSPAATWSSIVDASDNDSRNEFQNLVRDGKLSVKPRIDNVVQIMLSLLEW